MDFLFEDDFGGLGALSADVEALGGVVDFDALEVEVLDRCCRVITAYFFYG